MDHDAQVIVLKFGSSVLRSEKDLPRVVHEIYRAWRNGAQVIAVVSAFGDTTDRLKRRAETVCAQPEKSALASLLATGEAASSALLGLALNNAGIAARVLDAQQVGLRTVGGRLDADPIALDTGRLLVESQHAVVVLPGSVGRGENGDTTLLGRGGSDYSALFLAHRLRASCVLLKDVDGLYTSDPAHTTVRASRFAQVSYDTALQRSGSVVQQKALRFAAANRVRFAITSIGSAAATEIGPLADRLAGSISSPEPLRVVLLGCGTVGGGVYQRLTALPDTFRIVAVGTRNLTRTRQVGVLSDLVSSDLEGLIEKPCDVVIELIGGTRRAAALTERVLHLGRHVVTANKALLAANGKALHALASKKGAALRYSAAVGGSMPALEAIHRSRAAGALRGFIGVVNSTSNFVLDRIAAGDTIEAAVRDAQQLGYAEAHPENDLNGIDAAQKLVLLTRAAFDVNLPLGSIPCEGIEGLNSETLRRSREQGKTPRLVVECRRTAHRIQASVGPVDLPLNHPLAQVHGADNRLVVEPEVGESLVVSGKGAGRWPTTEAVLADLFDLRRDQLLEGIEDLQECVA